MKNKILSCVLSGAFLLQGAVLAEDTATEKFAKLNKNSYVKGSVTVSGQLTEPIERVLTFRAVKPDGNVASVADIYVMKEIKTDAEGNFSVTVYTDDSDDNGEYTYYIGGRGYNTPVEGSFYFYTSDEQARFAEEVNDSEDVKTVVENEDNQKRMISMNCYVEDYLDLDDEYRDYVCGIVEDSDVTDENLNVVFNRAVAIAELNSIGTADEIYDAFMENAKTLTIETGKDTTVEWMGEERTTKLLKKLFKENDFETADEFEEIFEEEVIIDAFNKALWNDMEHLLTINSEVLGIELDFGKYESKKNNAYKALVKAAEKNAFTDMDEIADAFEDAVDELAESGNKKPSSGGGGGGGGGSSVPVVETMKNPDVKKEETKPENNPDPVVPEVKFESELNDLDSAAWAKEAVVYLEEKKVVSGNENKNFNPNANITREQFVTMLALAFGYSDKDAENVFADVADDAWYKANVAGAYKAGIVNGVSETEFGIGRNITRQDMAAMLYRIVVKENISIAESKDSPDFADKGEIASYAENAVDYLYRRAVINGMGDGSFAPGKNATKAQAAVMISSVLKAVRG